MNDWRAFFFFVIILGALASIYGSGRFLGIGWETVGIKNGYRIQHGPGSTACRLLSPNGNIEARGSDGDCRQNASNNKRAFDIDNKHVVVIVAPPASLSGNPHVLQKNLSHFSLKSIIIRISPIDNAREVLSRIKGDLNTASRISWIGLGIAGRGLWRTLTAPNFHTSEHSRAVFVGSPIKGFTAAAWTYALTPLDHTKKPGIPFATIAGSPGRPNGLNPFLGSENDGLVQTSEAAVSGAAIHRRVFAWHGNIAERPSVAAIAADFLRYGRASRPPLGRAFGQRPRKSKLNTISQSQNRESKP